MPHYEFDVFFQGLRISSQQQIDDVSAFRHLLGEAAVADHTVIFLFGYLATGIFMRGVEVINGDCVFCRRSSGL